VAFGLAPDVGSVLAAGPVQVGPMADDPFGQVVHQIDRCRAGSVAVCPVHSGSHLDGSVPADRAQAGWHRADSAADDLGLSDSHPDDWVAVCPVNCGSHPVGLVRVDPAQAG